MSAMTLAEGIKKAILEAIPEVAEVVDATDHARGRKPLLQLTCWPLRSADQRAEHLARRGGDAGGVEAELGEDARRACRARCTPSACPGRHFGPWCAGRGSRRGFHRRRRRSRRPSSTVTTARCVAASASIAGSSGLTTRASHTVTDTPSAREPVGGLLGGVEHLADADDADVACPCAAAGRAARGRPRRSCAVRAAVLGQRMATGPVVMLERVVRASDLQLLVRRRGEHRHARHLGEQHHVEHAVVRRPVVAGDAGAVEAEHDRLAVQADVEVDLVEGPGEERGVDGDDGAQAAHGHAGRRGDRVLLGDADVEAAVGEALARTAAGRWSRAWRR